MAFRWSWLSTLFLFLTLVLSACGQTPQPSAPSPEASSPVASPKTDKKPTEGKKSSLPDLKGRKLVIGSDTTYPPMESVDEQTKEIVGFDVDLLEEIGKLTNAEVEFKSFPNFDAIFAALANKEFDLVVSSVSVTEERKKIIAFSDPYLSIGQVISVPKANSKVKDQADLKDLAFVGVQGGTTGEKAARAAGLPETKIKRYDTIDVAFQDLASGAIDAVVADGPPSARYAKQFADKVKIVGKPFTTEDYAIALQKDDSTLQTAVNAALKELKANGTMKKLLTKWNLQDVATLP